MNREKVDRISYGEVIGEGQSDLLHDHIVSAILRTPRCTRGIHLPTVG